jgi:hypothetical protein
VIKSNCPSQTIAGLLFDQRAFAAVQSEEHRAFVKSGVSGEFTYFALSRPPRERVR